MPVNARLTRLAPWACGAAFLVLYLHLPRDWDAICTSNDYFFADAAENVEGVRGFVFGRPLHRHVLFSPLSHPLYLIGRVVSPATAPAFPTALFGAAGASCVYALSRRITGGAAWPLLASVLFGFSASQLVYAGVPETYVPSGTLILVSLLVWFHEPAAPGWRWPALLWLTLVAVGLMNPVLGVLLGAVYLVDTVRTACLHRIARVAAVFVASLAATLLIRAAVLAAAMPRLTWWDTIAGSGRYLQTYGDFRHFQSGSDAASMVLGTLVFSLGALPVASFGGAPVSAVYARGWRSLAGYSQTIDAAAFAAAGFALVMVLLLRGGPSARARWTLGLYLLFHLTFFLWFNPPEAILYAPAAVGPLVLFIFDAAGDSRRRVRRVVLCLFVGATVAHNLAVFSRPIPPPFASHHTFEGVRNEKSIQRR